MKPGEKAAKDYALRGTGSVRKKGKRYQYRVSIDGQRFSFSGRTPAEAQAKALEARKEHRIAATHEPTVRDWFATWLTVLRDGGRVADQTWATYARHGRLYIVPAIGDLRLDALRLSHIDTLHAYAARRVSGTTSAQIHRTLTIALNAALARGHQISAAVRTAERPRGDKRHITTLNREEIERLLAAAHNDALEAAYALAVLLGVRRGELLGLRWEHVDLERRRIRIAGNATVDRNGKRVITAPKTATARRTLPLPELCIDALRRTPRVGELVWPGRDGGPIASSTFDKRWKEMTKSAGIRPVNFHALRHTAATLALQDDRISPHIVAAMLGHSSVAFTLATYAHVTHASAEAVVDAIDSRYGPRLRVVGSSTSARSGTDDESVQKVSR